MDAGVGVNENAFSGEALSAVARDGVAVVEVTMVGRVELNVAVVVEASGNSAVRRD